MKIFALFFLIVSYSSLFSQTLYNNFEGIKLHYFENFSGIIDSSAQNPAPNWENNSSFCAEYIRNNSEEFDSINLNFYKKLVDVSQYSNYLGHAKKIRLKVLTNAPLNEPEARIVLVQLTKRGVPYPGGVHSIYTAELKKQNEWENVELSYVEMPEGSETTQKEVDQMRIFFAPFTFTNNTYYFDNLEGPDLVLDSGEDTICIKHDFALLQNYPNPASTSTTVEFEIVTSGTEVSLNLYDTAGRLVKKVIKQYLETGKHIANINLEELDLIEGIYFYTLQVGDMVKGQRMILLR